MISDPSLAPFTPPATPAPAPVSDLNEDPPASELVPPPVEALDEPPANERVEDPEDSSAVERIMQLEDATVEDLAGDHSRDLHRFFNEHKKDLSPAMFRKLSDAEALRRSRGLTKGAIVQGAKNVPGALEGIGRSLNALSKNFNPMDPRFFIGKNVDLLKKVAGGAGPIDAASDQILGNIAEGASGVESMAMNTASLVRSGLSKAADFVVTPVNVEPYENERTFLEDAAVIEQQDKAARGQGEVAKFAKLDADSMAQVGIELDPEVIQGVSLISDPTILVPLLQGLRVARVAGGGFQAVNRLGQVLATSKNEAALAGFVENAGKAMESGGKAVGDFLHKVAGRRSLVGSGGMISGTGALLVGHTAAPAIISGLAAKQAAQYGARGVQLAGEVLGSEAGAKAAAATIFEAGRAAKQTLKGAIQGGVVSIPFAAAMEEPSEQVTMAGIGAAIGAGGALAPRIAPAIESAGARAKEILVSSRWQTGHELPQTRASVLAVPGMETFEANHAQARESLRAQGEKGKQEAAKLDLIRAGLSSREGGVESYLMTKAQAEAANPALKGKSGAFPIEVLDANGQPKKIVAWVMGDDGAVVSLLHEPGHVIFRDIATPAEQAEWKSLFSQKQVDAYKREYLKDNKFTDEQKAAIDDDAIREELAVESISQIMEGRGLSYAEPTLRERLASGMLNLLERTGVYEPGIVEGYAGPAEGNVSRFGVEQSEAGARFAQRVYKRFKDDFEVQAGIEALGRPGGKTASPTGSRAPAAPAAPKVSPVDVRLAELKKSGTDVAAAKLLAKRKSGVPLTPSEQQNLDAFFPGMDLGQIDPVAPVVPPAPKPEAPVTPAAPVGDVPVTPAKPPTPQVTPEVTPEVTPQVEPTNIKGVTQSGVERFGGLSDQSAITRIEDKAASVAADPKANPQTKTVFQVIKDNVGKVLKLTYDSAKETGSKSAESYNKRRVEVEEARNDPSLRAAADKFGVIVKDVDPKTGALITWNGDAVLANAKRVLDQVDALAAEKLVPYPMKNGKLADGGLQLSSDVLNYLRNQNNGYKGNGQPIVRPENMTDTFIPPVREGYQPVLLSDNVADFANLLMGEQPPITTKVYGAKIPVPVRANRIAEANQRVGAGTGKVYDAPVAAKGQEITDYNPTRVALKKAGANLDLIPASERLNPDRVLAAEPMPGVQFEAPASDVIAAGFAPEKPGTPLRIRKPITLTGPDGAQYPAFLDGIQKGFVGFPDQYQITPQADIPGTSFTSKSTTYSSKLNKEGVTFPDLSGPEFADAGKPAPGFAPEKVQTDKAKTGLAFKKFFSDVINEKFGKSDVPYEPSMDLTAHQPFVDSMSKFSAGFAAHIAKSIPTYLESHVIVGDAIVKTFPEGARVLDVGSSEGYFGKAITEQSGGKISTVSLDPNGDMHASFQAKPQVEGATFTTDAFMEGFVDGDTVVRAYKPTGKFDVVHEAMTFQFVSPDRPAHIAEAKRLMTPDGVFITKQKVRNADWAKNEATKDTQWKNKYFSKEELKAKEEVVGFKQSKSEEKAVGMVDNMVSDVALEAELKNQFANVVQIWDSGNFKGYAASDNAAKLSEFVGNVSDLNTKFSTRSTPREVTTEKPGFAPAKTDSGKAKEADGYTLTHFRDPATLMNMLDFRKGGVSVAELQYYTKPDKSAAVSWTWTNKDLRRQGFAEALYREMGARLQEEGVTKVVGTAIAEPPIQLRKKVFGDVEVRAAKSPQGVTYGELKTVESPIRPETKFAPEKTEADQAAREVAKFKAASPKLAEFSSPATLGKALKKDGWAILTATQEEQGPHSNKFNTAANRELKKRLDNEGYDNVEVSGFYKGIDQGVNFLVTGIPAEKALEFALDYNQESVVLPEGLVYNDGSVQVRKPAGDVVGEAAAKKDNYTRVKNGPVFSLEFADKKTKSSVEETALLFEEESKADAADNYDRAAVSKMTVAQKKAHWPEARFYPRVKNSDGAWVAQPVGSELVDSPLVRKLGAGKAAEHVGNEFARRIKENMDDPNLQNGKTWYSRFTPVLKKFFGKDAQIFAEFLAGTSPQSQPAQNFKDALHAYQLYKKGWYDEMIARYNEGLDGLADGSLKKAYEADDSVKKRPANPSDATYLGWWVNKHNLVPVKAPRLGTKGEILDKVRYNTQSAAVMKIAARRWMDSNGGPKTANFVRNLTGDSIEATIDLWADRSVREVAYKGFVDRWRIQPENGAPVSNPDFYFAQEGFRHAAKQLGWTPAEVQGAMWFLEKSRWAKEGWSPLNLGDYLPHLQELAAKGSVKDLLAEIPATREKALADVIIQQRKFIEAQQELKDLKIQRKTGAGKNQPEMF